LHPYRSEDNAYVVLDGELDLGREAEIRAAFPSAESITSAVINLSRATYVDSVVMGILVQFRRQFIAAGGQPQNLALMLAKDGPIRRAFELTGLTRFFPIAYVEPTVAPPEEHIAASVPAAEHEEV
jgi:anti-anti-sigma factor